MQAGLIALVQYAVAANARDAPIASVDDVIDPIQSEKPDENQVDSHCEALIPGTDVLLP